MEKGHILKFVSNGKTLDKNIGIRVYPRQTYGVSQQSPDHFKQSHTLIGENGYLYRHQNDPQFEYPSQKKYIDVYQITKIEQNQNLLHQKLNYNTLAFHKKKGRLSQFMDKNGWMSAATKIMGFQRNQNARFLSNRDRERKINCLKPRIKYQNLTKNKSPVNPQYFNTIQTIMTQKVRIRKKRNQLADKKRYQSARPITVNLINQIQTQNIAEKIAKINNDFYSTQSTFYQPGNSPKSRRINSKQISLSFSKKRSQSPSYQIKKHSPFIISRDSKSKAIIKQSTDGNNSLQFKEDLQKWYRSTCHSNWVYNPKKMDSQERQQYYQIQDSTK